MYFIKKSGTDFFFPLKKYFNFADMFSLKDSNLSSSESSISSCKHFKKRSLSLNDLMHMTTTGPILGLTLVQRKTFYLYLYLY
jgi:hypothetical protein